MLCNAKVQYVLCCNVSKETSGLRNGNQTIVTTRVRPDS